MFQKQPQSASMPGVGTWFGTFQLNSFPVSSSLPDLYQTSKAEEHRQQTREEYNLLQNTCIKVPKDLEQRHSPKEEQVVQNKLCVDKEREMARRKEQERRRREAVRFFYFFFFFLIYVFFS